MTKLVVLKLDGDLQQGVRVTLSIAFEGVSPHKEVTGNLPAVTELQTKIDQWRSHYRSLGSDNRAIKAKKVTYDGSITAKYEDCKNSATELQKRLNNWLKKESFRSIRESWLKELQENEIVRVLIRTSSPQLRQIPWHLWDLVEEYPNAELALSATDYQKTITTKTPSIRDEVKILAILGNSTGIDVETDRRLLNSLPDASVTFLVQPQRHEINDQLWEKPWDILFFAGHSQTVGDKGRIYINENKESLTTDDLKYGLKKAKSNGLAVAIFNSCDGLGLASSLETLHIPQIIVMREQVPDEVAQIFLKHFLEDFAIGGKSLYQAAKEARLKLHGLEDKYPCASWLPVICQNTDVTPPNWLDLGRRPTDIIPYRGLFAFRSEDAQFFFGRETFTDLLVDAVQNQPLVAVIGSSGSGKSSVVFAGLVRRLIDAGNWHIVDFRPGSRPLFNLATALIDQQETYYQKDSQVSKQLFSRTERLREMRNLASDLGQYENGLRDVVDDIKKQNQFQHFLLIADQFEELYTMTTDAQERQTFLDRLLEAIYHCRNFTFVITLRADFLGQALSYRPFADALQYADLKLSPMTDEELQAAVEKPASLLGVTIEQGLVERILSTISVEPGNLPLLEFALTQLWAKQVSAQLNHAAYNQIGGVEAALACYADSAYNQLNFEEKERAQRIFTQLVHPGEGASDTRRVATRAEVGEENWDLVTRLADARLVVTGRDEKTGLDTVEVVHEALISSWSQLHQWMQQDRDFRHWQEQLRVAMRTWESSGFDEGALLRGKPLADAEYWERQRFLELSALERSFIGLSVELRAQQIKKQKHRRQLTISSLAGGLVLALMLASVAGWQWHKSVEQTAIAKAASVENLLQTNPLAALVQAIDAVGSSQSLFSRVPPREVQSSLLWAVQIAQFGTIERNILISNKGYVLSVRISPDGNYIANSNADGTLQLWDFKGNPIGQPLKGHSKSVFALAFSKDGKYIVSGSEDKTLRLWDISGKPIGKPFKGHQETIRSVAFSPDGKHIVSGAWDRTLRLWDMSGNPIGKPFKAQETNIYSVAFSPSGQYIVSGASSVIRLWDIQGNRVGKPFKVGSNVFSVAFSPDGKYIVSGSDDQAVRLWDMSGNPIGQPFRGHQGEVRSVTFSTDGKYIISGATDNTVRVWDLSGNPIGQPLRGHQASVTSVTISRDQKTIISGSEDQTIRLWDTEKSSIGKAIGHENSVMSVAFSPSGRYIVSACLDGKVRLWDLNGNLIGKPLLGHSMGVLKAVFSPDGQYIASSSQDSTIRLWDIKGNQIGQPFKGHLGSVQAIAFSPNGKYIVSGGEDKTLRLWDIKGNTIGKPLLGHEKSVTSVTFSSDGKYIISGSDDATIRLWNLKGEPIGKPFRGHKASVSSIAISLDGKYIISGSWDKTLRLWDFKGNQIGQPFTGHGNHIFSVAFSPDGQYIASSSEDQTLRLWDINGNPIGTPLKGHEGGIWSVAISPDGHTIASGAWDTKMRLWQGGTWQTLLQLGCNRLRGHSVFVQPQTQIASAAAQTCQKYVWGKLSLNISDIGVNVLGDLKGVS
ncbi:CHAT domain-containing protein [Dulcicalothrix desertica]|nr:CHAT domain-containing protein [Dulcicalothrix desertica]TWH42322.1 WD40 repeat protein [Dulcicalothrix desertica PCC 7102]